MLKTHFPLRMRMNQRMKGEVAANVMSIPISQLLKILQGCLPTLTWMPFGVLTISPISISWIRLSFTSPSSSLHSGFYWCFGVGGKTSRTSKYGKLNSSKRSRRRKRKVKKVKKKKVRKTNQTIWMSIMILMRMIINRINYLRKTDLLGNNSSTRSPCFMNFLVSSRSSLRKSPDQ